MPATAGSLDPALAVLALLGLGALLAAIFTLLGLDGKLRALARRSAAVKLELDREPDPLTADELIAVQEFATDAVEAGTSGVRGVHRVISDIPFDVLDSIATTRGAARVVRQAHDGVTDGVYDAISEVNRVAGGVFRLLRRPHTPPQE
ncbi:hypothetical protein [Pseudonocardia sp. GCM10023141]|uniref:hypothetical protein n=1 Tax=Pseudonocardia sp. GCM10023141 TaxID=3252653 RepID=UPI00361754DD